MPSLRQRPHAACWPVTGRGGEPTTAEVFTDGGDLENYGLIALLRRLYDGLALAEVLKVDAKAELGRLGLEENLSSQRSNGLRAMIERIRGLAAENA